MTDTLAVALVDAFATEPMTGNPAGVVPEASDLAADQMAAIASELGASETAFVREGDEAGRTLRYFTPETEIDRCGHATIAAFSLLTERGTVTAGTHEVETAAGVLEVEVTGDRTVWTTQSPPEIDPVDVSLADAAATLGLEPAALSEVGDGLPIARASTGVPFLVVPVAYFDHLSGATPDRTAVETLCERADATGLYAFTFDTLEPEATLHGRTFAPLAGIPEDPVTGTASGAVGAYLRHYGAVDAPDPLVFEQGHFLDRPGRVRVRTGGTPAVGGEAVTVLEGDVVVPESEDDDILTV